MEAIIRRYLKKIEEKRDIEIFYACESGSRAWGFHSSNSDWDVRFLFKYPVDKYLGMKGYKDAFDIHIKDLELDFAGWDIRKAACLLKNYNASLVEWLNSPVVYCASESSEALRKMSPDYFNPKTALFHYLNLASGVYKKYIQNQDPFILKKSLYVIRPLVCARYIIKFGKQPPTNFQEVLSNDLEIDPYVLKIFEEIVAKKMAAKELGHIPKSDVDPILMQWIESDIKYIEEQALAAQVSKTDIDPLNDWTVKTLRGYYSILKVQ